MRTWTSMNLSTKCFLPFFIFLLSISSYSQTEKRTLKYSGLFDTYYYKGPIKFIGHVGSVSYNGQGNERVNFKSGSLYGGMGIGYQFLPYSMLVAEANVMNLGYDYTLGDDSKVSFSSNNFELNLHSRIYLLSDHRITKRQDIQKGFRTVKLYLLAGIGFTWYKAQVDINDTTFIGQKKPHYAAILPLGIGVEYRLSDKISLLGELSRRFWLSDEDPINQEMMSGYHTASFKIQYSPWGIKKKKKIKLPAPTTPTHFYSPNGVAPNKKKREEENGSPSTEEEPLEEEDLDTEEGEDPFGDF